MTDLLKAAEATRLKLREAGFAPIPVNGKIPLISGWQTLGNSTAGDITSWTDKHPTHGNTGAITARMPTLDIDIKDPEAAEAVERMVRDRFGDGGTLLFRYGNAPKRAIPFQTAKPFPKIEQWLIAPNGDTTQKLELLCSGQQVVVDGIHPDTRRPYTWRGGELGDVKLVDLPCINESEARKLVRDAVELLVAEHGYKIAKPRPKANGDGGEHIDGAKDWSWLIDAVIQGGSLHDNTCALAAKVVASGMRGGAAVNLIRAVMEQSKAPRDERFSDRLSDIPRLVSSAENKIPPDQEAAPPAAWNFHDGRAAAPTRWSVKGILPEIGVALISGQWGTFKTAIALDLSVSIMADIPFADRYRIKRRGAVLYIALEGEGMLSSRLSFIAASRHVAGELPFAWRGECPALSEPGAGEKLCKIADEAIAAVKTAFDLPIAMAFVDTVVTAAQHKTDGGDNDAAAAQRVMTALKVLSKHIGAVVVGIDHFGKVVDTGTRGSSAKEGAVDTVLAVLADRELSGGVKNTRLAVRKQRDGISGFEIPFTAQIVETGKDEDGDPTTAVAIDWSAPQQPASQTKSKWPPSTRLLRRVLTTMLVDHGKDTCPFNDGPRVRACDIELVRNEFYKQHPADGTEKQKAAARRQAFGRAVKSCGARSLVGVREVEGVQLIWLVSEGQSDD